MAASEWGAIPAILFGLWLVVLPKSFIHFQEWLHRRYSMGTKLRMPDAPVIRVLGIAWLLLVLGVAWKLPDWPAAAIATLNTDGYSIIGVVKSNRGA